MGDQERAPAPRLAHRHSLQAQTQASGIPEPLGATTECQPSIPEPAPGSLGGSKLKLGGQLSLANHHFLPSFLLSLWNSPGQIASSMGAGKGRGLETRCCPVLRQRGAWAVSQSSPPPPRWPAASALLLFGATGLASGALLEDGRAQGIAAREGNHPGKASDAPGRQSLLKSRWAGPPWQSPASGAHQHKLPPLLQAPKPLQPLPAPSSP